MRSHLGILFVLGALCGVMNSGCYSGDKTLVPKPPYEPVEIEESYVLKFEPRVDILFVVDDSGSMYSHQMNLASNLNLFTQAMEKNKFIDYHIGVISTSADRPNLTGKLRGNPAFITKDTDNGLTLLANNIVALGTNGSYKEMMATPIYAALGPGTDLLNPGFVRSDAFLVVILVTDAEDQSKDISGFRVYNALLRNKGGDAEKVLGYAVLAYPKLFGDQCGQDEYKDPVLNEAFMSAFTNAYNSIVAVGVGGNGNTTPTSTTNTSGGPALTNIFSLCDNQYGQKLANIGEDIRQRVSRSIPLPKLPVRGTIKLKYGSHYVDSKWWKYDPTTQSLLLDPNIELIEEEGAQFSVVMDQSNPDETIGAPSSEEDLPYSVEATTK